MTLNLSGFGDTTVAGYDTSTGTGIDTSNIDINPNTPVPYDVAQAAFNQLPVTSPAFSQEASDIASQAAAYGGTPYGAPTSQPAANTMNWVILAAVLGGLVLISSAGGRRR